MIGVAGVALSGSKISILASFTAGTLFPSRSSQESTVKELVAALKTNRLTALFVWTSVDSMATTNRRSLSVQKDGLAFPNSSRQTPSAM